MEHQDLFVIGWAAHVLEAEAHFFEERQVAVLLLADLLVAARRDATRTDEISQRLGAQRHEAASRRVCENQNRATTRSKQGDHSPAVGEASAQVLAQRNDPVLARLGQRLLHPCVQLPAVADVSHDAEVRRTLRLADPCDVSRRR